MTKNSQRQNGSVHILAAIILVVALLGILGFMFYQNFINKDLVKEGLTEITRSVENSPDSTTQSPVYTLDDAVKGISETLLEKGCGGSGASSAIAKDMFEEVDDSAPYTYRGGLSKINTGLSYAFVQYGCGSQGSIALLKKIDNEWVLISDDARVYPMCERVSGQGLPTSIIDRCYIDDRATEPVAI